MSGSDVQLLIPGTTVYGKVSNRENTYKIYELIINKHLLFNDSTSTDLYISVAPCKGKVDFFVSESYSKLFETSQKITPS